MHKDAWQQVAICELDKSKPAKFELNETIRSFFFLYFVTCASLIIESYIDNEKV